MRHCDSHLFLEFRANVTRSIAAIILSRILLSISKPSINGVSKFFSFQKISKKGLKDTERMEAKAGNDHAKYEWFTNRKSEN
jgi:hypothetical protein